MKRTIKILLAVLVGVILLVCAGGTALVDFLANLTLGWPIYIARVLPKVQVNWPAALSAALCLIGVVMFTHLSGRWLWREVGGGVAAMDWKPRWTLCIVAIIVLMFVCGLGVVGATHQSVWLARSEQPLTIMSSGPRVNRIKCASNMRQIGNAISEYAKTHDGRFPGTLQELLLTQDITAEIFICPATNDERSPGATTEEQARHLHEDCHCSYVYHGGGMAFPVAPDVPILCEPLSNHDDDAGMNVLLGSMEVQWMSGPELEKAMRASGH